MNFNFIPNLNFATFKNNNNNNVVANNKKINPKLVTTEITRLQIKNLYIKFKIKKFKKHIFEVKLSLNKLLSDIDALIDEFEIIYKEHSIKCKYSSCTTDCADDIGYCLKHYPSICNDCNYICNPEDNYDKLTYNTYYNINGLCNKCTQNIFSKYYSNIYEDNVLYNDSSSIVDNIFSTYNYKQYLLFSELLKDLQEKQIATNMKNYELKEKLCDPKLLIKYFDVPADTITTYSKWYLYRQIYRANELVELFGDKIKYIKIPCVRFRRMSYIQFQGFKDFLCRKIVGKPLSIYILENVYGMTTNYVADVDDYNIDE